MNRRRLTWALFVTAWTAGLLCPIYVALPESDAFQVAKAVVFKTVHVVGYATLTVLTARLEAAPRTRLLLLFFVMAHGAATEMIQTVIPGRGGAVRDVCIDHAGVLLGLYWSWAAWTRGLAGLAPPATSEAPSENGVAQHEPVHPGSPR